MYRFKRMHAIINEINNFEYKSIKSMTYSLHIIREIHNIIHSYFT